MGSSTSIVPDKPNRPSISSIDSMIKKRYEIIHYATEHPEDNVIYFVPRTRIHAQNQPMPMCVETGFGAYFGLVDTIKARLKQDAKVKIPVRRQDMETLVTVLTNQLTTPR
jgi:hypothetical protein